MSKQITIYKVYTDTNGKAFLASTEAKKTPKKYSLTDYFGVFGWTTQIDHSEAYTTPEEAYSAYEEKLKAKMEETKLAHYKATRAYLDREMLEYLPVVKLVPSAETL